MKSLAWATVFALAAATAHAQEICDRKFGTALRWEESIDHAAAQARKEGRLVLVLHVSGHFDKAAET